MRRFWADRAGNTAVLFAVGLPLVAAAGAIGTQYSELLNRRSALQQAADGAALAAAQQLKLANASDAVVASVAASTVQADTGSLRDTISVATQVLQHRTGVTVIVSDTVPLAFGKIIGMSSVTVESHRDSATLRSCRQALHVGAGCETGRNPDIRRPDVIARLEIERHFRQHDRQP